MPTSEDSTRFEGTAEYYAEYRPGYGDDAIDYLAERFDLDESARVLDLGCGAGQITVPIAAYAGDVVGMDPNEAMLEQARERATVAGRENIEWVRGSDADLDDNLGPVRLTTMGRSFHWMDERETLRQLHRITEPGGGVALVTGQEWLTKGRRDWQAVAYDVATEFVDDLPERVDPDEVEYDDPWDELIAEFGFGDVAVEQFPVEREWDADDVVGYVLSLSFCSPRILGDDREAFERDLRASLDELDAETFPQTVDVEVLAGTKDDQSSPPNPP